MNSYIDSIETRLATVSTLALDVDGVLTDGAVWWSDVGDEFRRFSFRDVMGVSMARRAGVCVALISGEDSRTIDRFAAKLGIGHVYKGCRQKDEALLDLIERLSLSASEVCFVGDDVNDLPAFAVAGVSVAVADAAAVVRDAAMFQTQAPGGNGAVREVVDHMLAGRRHEQERTCKLAVSP